MQRFFLLATAVGVGFLQAESPSEGEWKPLFNGRDLTGWTPKFRGEKLGVNYLDTFRVEDGVLKVSYDNYEEWGERFGHLFYEKEFSHYKLRAQYRFVGEQVKGGPNWAWRNNGLMIHGEPAEDLELEQKFPRSIEVQLLGGRAEGERHTANVCTPETHIVVNGKLEETHCLESISQTYRGDQWVEVEVEVHGSEKIIHRVEGEVVFEYEFPQTDDGEFIDHGTISIQAESAPIEFRKIEILELPTPAAQK